MKRVLGAWFILSTGLWGQAALGQAANSAAPPSAQFPSVEPVPTPAPKPANAPPAAQAPTALPASPPPPPGAASPAGAPPPAPGAYPAYPYPPYPPAYPYAPPELIPVKPPSSDSDEVFSITISPLHLLFPIVQLTGEVRATPHFGISVIAGYGSLGVDTTTNGVADSVKVTAYEIGGRLIGYPLKKFKSLQFGAQLMYLKVDTATPISSSNVSGTGAGIAFGPFAGYKLVTSGGFTFLAQLGVQYLSAQAEAHETTGLSNSARDNRFLPLVNLDVGWSF